MRDHRNYFGQSSQPFVVVSEFELTSTSLRIAFDAFKSAKAFDDGEDPLPNLRRQFGISGDELSELIRANADLFESILSSVREIAGARPDWVVKHLSLSTVRWVLVVRAVSPTSDDDVLRTKTAPEYHQIIAANLTLIAQVLTIAWEYGKSHDAWLNSLAPVQ